MCPSRIIRVCGADLTLVRAMMVCDACDVAIATAPRISHNVLGEATIPPNGSVDRLPQFQRQLLEESSVELEIGAVKVNHGSDYRQKIR